MSNVKFPGVPAILGDGNAFAIMGAVVKAIKQNGGTKEDTDQYMKEATAGDYDNLLVVSMSYVDVKLESDQDEDLLENMSDDEEGWLEEEDEDDPNAQTIWEMDVESLESMEDAEELDGDEDESW